MTSQRIYNVLVFTGDLNFSVRKGIRDILDQFEGTTIHILLHQPVRRKAALLRSQIRNVKKHGSAWLLYQIRELALRRDRYEPTDKVALARPGSRFELHDLMGTGRVKMTALHSINGDQARRVIEELSPDLGISLAAPLLKPAVFTLPRMGTINLHKGKLPNYRGMPPAFWEISDGQTFVGCTIHQVEAVLDSGPIITDTEIPLEKFSTPNGMRIRLDRVGNELLIKAIRDIRGGTARLRSQSAQGPANRRPSLKVERRLLRQLAIREGTTGYPQLAKDIITTGYSVVQEMRRRVWPARAATPVVILLYHRVNDALRDNITIGVERFDQQMAYLRRYWAVVPLRALVRGEVERSLRHPLVCITFDDGYRDNYDYAASILLKHRLPATFFVSTGKLTRQEPFDHDLKKLERPLPNMSWDQAREMQREGLDFGSHTVNHANLGRIAADEIWAELVGSRETLRRELRQQEFLFAYPFGKKGDITSEAKELVRKAEYVCCCSAYGGVNEGEFDAFNILRIGVNYRFSLAALRARLNGWS